MSSAARRQPFGALTLIRTTAKATISHYRPGLLGADHQWKMGGQFERGEHHSPTVIPTGVRFVDNNGQPFQADLERALQHRRCVRHRLRVRERRHHGGDRLTINAGLRFDHSRAISQDLPALDPRATKPTSIVRGLGTLYTWNSWSPRLGRHHEAHRRRPDDAARELRAVQPGRPDRRAHPFHPGATPTTTTASIAATGDYTTPISVVDPKSNLQLDPETRAPRTDEYSIGVDREVGRRLAVAIAYVRKNGGNFIGWTDVGGQYREETRTLADGRTCRCSSSSTPPPLAAFC